jgi:hypothetical protein
MWDRRVSEIQSILKFFSDMSGLVQPPIQDIIAHIVQKRAIMSVNTRVGRVFSEMSEHSQRLGTNILARVRPVSRPRNSGQAVHI